MESRVVYRAVAPVKPAAGYIGGKKKLSKMLVDRISRIPHETYAEPFVGMGGVFLRRPRAPRGEIINDRSGDVATFFRILQRHYVPFMDMLRWQFTGRQEFERLKASDPGTLTDLERAARFLYLQRTAFGGKVAGRNFGVDPLGGRFNVTKLAPILDALHDRLAGVVIECLPWADFIARYDRPGTLFYLDPPYWGGENDYGAGMFDRVEFERMAAVLRGLQGHFILSINDVPDIRKTFAGFTIKPVSLTYTVARSTNAHPARELIISRRRFCRRRIPT
ncbi:DNA adenine methylase [Nitrobacter winogradskyi]|uniref:DNA adenine methylase n=2 Tax=Nitrobacter winogradskyi TaxID=913 RepID=A0ACC6AGG0_NITWI|nr:DNA adenine methylase [Nitrobacter winogradskyi]MCP1998833.1 DNA adenine methylase [Nitrobacter winogradskyi]GEC14246.1 DNA methyltransferase [Nitrobacter winogradskyi]